MLINHSGTAFGIFFNPFNPKIDQQQFSPNKINFIEMITEWEML